MIASDPPRPSVADGAPDVAEQPPVIILVTTQADVSHARILAAAMASQMGFGAADTQRLATAVSELGNNLVAHARKGGRLSIAQWSHGGQRIEINAEDDGPGIADLDAAMTDGFSTNDGLGCGLGSCRRLMDQFAIDSIVGQGTRVRACLRLPALPGATVKTL
jgi:serine/threonine-protein kinase RsbT